MWNGGKLASSFGKRKYTQGYFWERAGSTEAVKKKDSKRLIARSGNGEIVARPVMEEHNDCKPVTELNNGIPIRDIKQLSNYGKAVSIANSRVYVNTADNTKGIQDRSDDEHREKKTDRLLTIGGLLLGVAGAVVLISGNIVMAGVLFLAGLIISGMGVRRGGGSVLIFIAFILNVIGLVIFIDYILNGGLA